MGSKGNTWCKKLVDKERRRVGKLKLGNEKGVLARGKGTFWEAARAVKHQQALLHGFERGVLVNAGGVIPATLEDELPPEGKVVEIKKIREFTTEIKDGFRPRAFGRRQKDRVGLHTIR